MFRKSLFFIASLSLVAACQSTKTEPDSEEPKVSATEQAMTQTSDGFGDAATAPLEDLNLKREKIPELLKGITNPYIVDPDMTCGQIAEEVMALDGVLGRDFDVPPPDKKSLDERAAEGASTALLDTVASGASGLIPYRGIVRTITGANSHKRKVLKAYERGSHRRTFLKGIGLMKNCPVPASPAPVEEDEPKVVFK